MLDNLFEKLKDIIKIDLRNAKFLNFQINLVKVAKDKEKVRVSEDARKIDINYLTLEESELKLLKEEIKSHFEKKEIDILESKSDDRVEDIKQKAKSQRNKAILSFYKDKISLKHWEALELSLYLKAVFEDSEPVNDLKRDIIRKYGNEGNIIANLCSAGYFEGHIKGIYEEMSFQTDFTPEKFKDYFELILRISPFAIFVSREMDEEELSGLVNYKLEAHKRYGINFIAIHGIGKNNVSKIINVVKEIEKKGDFKIIIKQDGNIILVKILF